MGETHDQFVNLQGEIKTLANTIWNNWRDKNMKVADELRSSFKKIIRAKRKGKTVSPDVTELYLKAEEQLSKDLSVEEASFVLEALTKNDHKQNKF